MTPPTTPFLHVSSPNNCDWFVGRLRVLTELFQHELRYEEAFSEPSLQNWLVCLSLLDEGSVGLDNQLDEHWDDIDDRQRLFFTASAVYFRREITAVRNHLERSLGKSDGSGESRPVLSCCKSTPVTIPVADEVRCINAMLQHMSKAQCALALWQEQIFESADHSAALQTGGEKELFLRLTSADQRLLASLNHGLFAMSRSVQNDLELEGNLGSRLSYLSVCALTLIASLEAGEKEYDRVVQAHEDALKLMNSWVDQLQITRRLSRLRRLTPKKLIQNVLQTNEQRA